MSQAPIKNASDTLLTENSGTLPQMGDVLSTYYQPMTFGIVTKEVVNSLVVETVEEVSFQGVWQPFHETQLQMMPRGQRDWSWWMLHSTTNLVLEGDMVIRYLGQQYRVMKVWPYELYGYRHYDLIEDFSGSGPS